MLHTPVQNKLYCGNWTICFFQNYTVFNQKLLKQCQAESTSYFLTWSKWLENLWLGWCAKNQPGLSWGAMQPVTGQHGLDKHENQSGYEGIKPWCQKKRELRLNSLNDPSSCSAFAFGSTLFGLLVAHAVGNGLDLPRKYFMQSGNCK